MADTSTGDNPGEIARHAHRHGFPRSSVSAGGVRGLGGVRLAEGLEAKRNLDLGLALVQLASESLFDLSPPAMNGSAVDA